ncbi:MAG: hypothetical protein A2Y14_02715 [Verrucomicrobia bacterium GWF2_51_19]|nr:MAG: hypothetical protein A2Y14_02715 [Verrucomicrobia bacterium GWF2_51_19]
MFEIKVLIDNAAMDAIEAYLIEQELTEWTFIQSDCRYALIGYFANPEDGQVALKAFPFELGDPDIRPISDADWKNEYKKYIRPWSYETLHWVPVWEKDYPLTTRDTAVYFDAGMAFGTGSHETTQLCGRAIFDFCKKHADVGSRSMADVGCGSGILAITAKKLGIGDVFGFDIDPDTLSVCRDNLRFNELSDIRFETADIAHGLKRPFDLVVANILAPVLIDHRETLAHALKKGGQLVLSGILKSEAETVCEAFNPLFRQNGAVSILGEWASVIYCA